MVSIIILNCGQILLNVLILLLQKKKKCNLTTYLQLQKVSWCTDDSTLFLSELCIE